MNACGMRVIAVAIMLAAGLQLPGCSKKEPSATAATPPVDAGAVQGDANALSADAVQASWAPEALEELLAPVALYPDPVLAQVLATSANPQEVLDAGNWLVQNPDLKGKELESAATAAGFTPPMIALVQFPTVVDMMCMEMNWTTEVGSAFQADEPAVLDAVQRLRKQAADMGNLPSSEQMKVATETQNGQQIIVVQPANPQVVYVPQYDPAAVYTTPAPAVAPAAPAQAGYSTGTLVTTGLLAFGAGILVNEIFDDDDHDHDDYYYPRWGHGYGGGGYYPPPYRPRYGGGFRPAHGYDRPSNYQHGFNNNNVVINTGGNSYFNRFDSDRKNTYRREPKSPISAARPNRPELQQLNSRASATAPAQRAGEWKGKTSYEGAKPGAREKAVAARPGAADAVKKAPAGTYAGAKPGTRELSKPQTVGARDRGRVADSRASAAAKPSAKPAISKPATLQAERPKARPTATKQPSSSHASAFQGSRNSGKAEQAASKRGRESKPQGARSDGRAKTGQKRER